VKEGSGVKDIKAIKRVKRNKNEKKVNWRNVLPI